MYSNVKLILPFYLSIPAFRGKQLITKCRLADMPFKYSQKCPTCLNYHHDTILHFLIFCTGHKRIRAKYQQHLPVLFSDQSFSDKLCCILLASMPYDTNVEHIHHVGHFIMDLWINRCSLLKIHPHFFDLIPYF